MAKTRMKTPYKSTYIEGTAVRKELPRKTKTYHVDKKPNVSHKIRRNRDKALRMNLPYVFMLTVAAVGTLYFCIQYLQVQSSIMTRIKNIENLESELETIKTANDALETRINTYVNLDYVYKVATEELGMVYANKNQVVMYDKTESEYVRQYEDIPSR